VIITSVAGGLSSFGVGLINKDSPTNIIDNIFEAVWQGAIVGAVSAMFGFAQFKNVNNVGKLLFNFGTQLIGHSLISFTMTDISGSSSSEMLTSF
jgi:hypothetical protein